MSTPAASTNVATGVSPSPAPDRNGQLLQLPGEAPVYLVLNAFRRWIPNQATFDNLFKGGATITPYPGIGSISEGVPLSDGAILAKGDSDTVYLVTNGMKMAIPNPDVFNAYQFDWGKIFTLPQIVVNLIPDGPVVDAPHKLQPLA